MAVLRDDHPAMAKLGKNRKLCTEWLAQDPFALLALGWAGIHGHVIALCRSAGFTPRVVQNTHEASTIVGLVAAGFGVSILPASREPIGVSGVAYIPLVDPAAMSEIHVAHQRDERSPLVARFLRLPTSRLRDA